ncbi:serine hydrolase domain-containing protein [Streptomyces sp. NPDC091376]|uniref:serine hydrolase domain-containing protein n=1 Tax=Streptomyces sp. NPDC091376 TaxID=3365994 RepID=UPI003802D4EC
MTRLRMLLASLAALLMVAVGASGAPAGTVGHDFDPTTVERLDTAITDVMERAGIPGVDVGLWIPGRGRYEKSFGVSDKESGAAMKSDLHMRIGSVTKTFTITGLLRLVDRGEIGLDDPVSRYVEGVPDGDRITLRQLAAMRSGLYNYTDDDAWSKSLLADPQRTYTPRQLLDYAFAHPPDFPPGTKWEYSNTNTVLLGLVIEKVTGRSLGAELEQQVYEPLGLEQTSFPTSAALPEPYARGYTDYSPTGATTTGATVDATHWNPSWAWAAGAMISSLEDLHTWVPALADGRLLEPATQKQRLDFGPTGHPGVAYGLGIMRVNDWIGHNGELPGYETLAVQLPSEDATLVVLINSDADHEGNSLSTLIGHAVTSVATPDHVFTMPSAPQSDPRSPKPSHT